MTSPLADAARLQATPALVRRRAVALLALALLAVSLLSGVASADERILRYHSDIQLLDDGGMQVTETIRIRVEGDQIRRGIYRDFPTDYRDAAGHRVRVAFDFDSALRNGSGEQWRSEPFANGVRVYLGKEDVLLPHGEHTYRLRYRTNRQLTFGAESHDELYWNVTGNGWGFPIDSASAEVLLPRSVPAEQLRAYGFTGEQGSQEAALEASVFAGGARYRSLRALQPGEGLSIVLEFPKGLIAPPTRAQQVQWLLADNASLLLMLLGLVLLWAYYAFQWHRLGRDPAAGVRMPLYEPPNGYSPATLRFVREMGYDQTCMAAAILGMAAKEAIRIDEDPGGEVTLRPLGAKPALASDERTLYSALFPDGSPLLLAKSASTAERMKKAQKLHRTTLAAGYEAKYFLSNRWVLWPGLGLSLLTLVAAVLALPGEAGAITLFMCVWLSLWSVGVYALVSAGIAAARGVRGIGSGVGAVVLWLFAVPFIAGELFGLGVLVATAGLGFVLGFIALIGTNLAFQHWMKAPTQLGARLLDRIEGFRWYLGVAERQELDSRYRPESRPELFSAYLPYALALEVEQAWAERFASALTPAQLEQAQPHWYHSSHGFSGSSLTGVTSGLSSSLSSGISSASTAPGSSSGGGGGGSGGGGGGGGGGGW